MLTYKTSIPDTIGELAVIVLKNRLHSKRYSMLRYNCSKIIAACAGNPGFRYNSNKTYKWIRNRVKHSRPHIILTVVFKDDIPIGCFMLMGTLSNFFVLPEYRNCGIATEMFKRTAAVYDLTAGVLSGSRSVVSNALSKKLNLAQEYCELKYKNHIQPSQCEE